MKKTINTISVRMEWCRRQSALARTEPEADGWRAEEDGLRDALMDCDHTDQYRLCSPDILRRYLLGFTDATALLKTIRAQWAIHAATTGTPQQATGDDR